jgi:hypothetical protein
MNILLFIKKCITIYKNIKLNNFFIIKFVENLGQILNEFDRFLVNSTRLLIYKAIRSKGFLVMFRKV